MLPILLLFTNCNFQKQNSMLISRQGKPNSLSKAIRVSDPNHKFIILANNISIPYEKRERNEIVFEYDEDKRYEIKIADDNYYIKNPEINENTIETIFEVTEFQNEVKITQIELDQKDSSTSNKTTNKLVQLTESFHPNLISCAPLNAKGKYDTQIEKYPSRKPYQQQNASLELITPLVRALYSEDAQEICDDTNTFGERDKDSKKLMDRGIERLLIHTIKSINNGSKDDIEVD
tara:strand:- start:9702 stop:10403 length:702 start_codon:yes stop_codon:yes gene_type:complete